MHWARTIYPDGKIDEKYVRKNRDGSVWGYGKKKELTPEISNPAFIETMKKHIAKDVELFGAHPGFVGVLAATEARDSTNPSFNTEHLRYRKETGRDIPPEVERGVLDYRGLAEYKKRFPDGVVPEDHYLKLSHPAGGEPTVTLKNLRYSFQRGLMFGWKSSIGTGSASALNVPYNVVLEGDNVITTSYKAGPIMNFYSTGTVTIKGTGTLTCSSVLAEANSLNYDIPIP